MKDYLTIAGAALVVMVLVALIGRKFNLSSRYAKIACGCEAATLSNDGRNAWHFWWIVNGKI